MDGVPCGWSTDGAQEPFGRSRPTADTLSRLAKLVARAEQKQDGRTPPSPCDCPECGQGFPNATDLSQHQESNHTLPKPHRCLSCGKEFSLLSSLQLHKCVCDSPPCEASGASDPGSPPDKSPHCQPHFIDSIPYACAPCGRGFSQKQALLYHQQAGCSEPPSPLAVDDASSPLADSPQPVSEAGSTPSDSSEVPGPSRDQSTACPFCPRTFRTGAGLHCHTRFYHTEEHYMARGVQKTIGGRAGSNAVTRRKSKSKLLSCRSCEMVFKSTANLYLHRKEKHSRENGDKSLTLVYHSTHVKRRNPEGYPCHICGRVFLHHLSRRAHSKQHFTQNGGSATVQEHTQPGENAAKDPMVSEKKPKRLRLTSNGTERAGPGRPSKKFNRLKRELNHPGRAKKVPRTEEESESEFPCPSCTQVFSLQSELREHAELHQSSVRRRQCSVCTQEMDTSKGPGSRKRRLYHCVPCQQAFSALDPFLKHCQEHLRVKVEEDCATEEYRLKGIKNKATF